MKIQQSTHLTVTFALLIIIILLLIMRNEGKNDILYSTDGEFIVFSMLSSNKEVVKYVICRKNKNSEIFSTPLYFSRFSKIKFYWAKNDNDFFVLSSDFGVECYIFNDNTWCNNFSISLINSDMNTFVAKLLEIPVSNDNEIWHEYDINNIPAPVTKYLSDSTE